VELTAAGLIGQCRQVRLPGMVCIKVADYPGNAFILVLGCILPQAVWPRPPDTCDCRPCCLVEVTQFSTAPFSIQAWTVSISSVLIVSLPCGILTSSRSTPDIMIYSELVMAEPGLTTGPNREPFITDA
jgi:hypothetical protein